MTPSTAEAATRLLERTFACVQRERMAGLPILNPALRVAAVGFRPWERYWLGVLVTPWSMNLVLLPRVDGAVDWASGTFRGLRFPAGAFDFVATREADIGGYAACSLFSPVQQFADQAAAESTAKAALDALFEADPAQGDPAIAEVPRVLSRRAFLRGVWDQRG
jgi:[NiFe] hydrogenase assembly HybE family chaperone